MVLGLMVLRLMVLGLMVRGLMVLGLMVLGLMVLGLTVLGLITLREEPEMRGLTRRESCLPGLVRRVEGLVERPTPCGRFELTRGVVRNGERTPLRVARGLLVLLKRRLPPAVLAEELWLVPLRMERLLCASTVEMAKFIIRAMRSSGRLLVRDFMVVTCVLLV
jgi:hypothetical protein